MRKLLFRLFCYLGNIEVRQEKKKVFEITFIPENEEALNAVLERFNRLRKLQEKYGMPSTDDEIVMNSFRIYEDLIIQEIEEKRPFFQKVDGDMVPYKFFLVDLK